jgi:hydrogenase nickel incorporation protein HypA/HybF
LHELSIVSELHRLSREAVASYGPGRIATVKITVGELSGVEPDLLAFAWEAVTSGGPDEGSKLDVEFRLARQLCASCGEVPERGRGDWLRLCPRCQEPMRVEGGDELDLVRVSYDTEEGE